LKCKDPRQLQVRPEMGGGFYREEVFDVKDGGEDAGCDDSEDEEARHGCVGEAGGADHLEAGVFLLIGILGRR